MNNGKDPAATRRHLSTGPEGANPICATEGLTRSSVAPANGRLLSPRTLGILAVSSLCLALAGCGSAPKGKKVKFSEEKYGVAASPRVVSGNKPVPKGGGRYMVGKPYKVAGKWYHPKDNPNYTSVGLASWYGPTFHGRMTANGEVFDRNAPTAAHTTMPLPSYARVTNLKNGRSMIVRVNDRGPFHGNRTIDLSEKVANMLDFKSAGVAKVKVEYVGKARMDGQDQSFLMASYRGPGSVEPGATMPGTMLAQADIPAASPTTSSGPAPLPRNRPYGPVIAGSGSFGQMVVAAFDPAVAFEAGAASVQVASLNTFESNGPATEVVGAASAPVMSYDGAAQPAAASEPVLAPGPAYLGQPSTFARGSAISSYRATARIEGAYAAFDAIGQGLSPRELAARQSD
ncbi:septal ring lytic transglycosylase RlpA family protein [Stappia indica]|uniref:Endolytic peptidoglycan transglycosylase RlpA n=1 Tax=Stappia indica TaxID=538381 RepID=A0A857C2H2_9HYPH|nr:septal ring lytic transglycosylase RlpA family protein [Stappia indica]QGZ33206.1 septal ring lytic transglycosylase RlpA family protein [Stappia indica]